MGFLHRKSLETGRVDRENVIDAQRKDERGEEEKLEIKAREMAQRYVMEAVTVAQTERWMYEVGGKGEETQSTINQELEGDPVAIHAFLMALVDGIHQAQEGSQEIHVSRAVELLRSWFFAHTPSLFAEQKMTQQLEVLAASLRVPEAQRMVGVYAVGEIVDVVHREGGFNVPAMQEYITTKPIDTQLQLLAAIETLGVQATALSARGSARAEDTFARLLQSVASSTLYPLVRMSAQVALDRMQFEHEVPTANTGFRFAGDRSGGSVRTSREVDWDVHNAIARAHPTFTRGPQEHFVRLATDVVGRSDQSGRVHALAFDRPQSALEDGTLILRDASVIPGGVDKDVHTQFALFQEISRPEMRTAVESQFGLHLERVPVRSQLAFLRMIATKESEEFEKVISCVERVGLDRQALLETFFATQVDSTVEQQLLVFAQQQPVAVVNAVIQEYASLVHTLDQIREEVRASGVNADAVTREMAQRCTLQLATVLRDPLPASIDRFQMLEKDLLLFGSLRRAKIEESGDVLKQEELGSMVLESRTSENLSGDDRMAMERCMEKSEDGSRGPDSFFVRVRMAKLREAFTHRSNTFFQLKRDGKLLGFFRMEDTDDGAKYLGSVTVTKEGQRSGLMDVLVRDTIDAYAKTHRILANAEVQNHLYIERYGFRAKGVIRNILGTGVDGWDLERDDLRVPVSSPIESSAAIGISDVLLAAQTNAEHIAVQYLPSQQASFLFVADQLLRAGAYAITTLRPRGGYQYVVFTREHTST